MPGCETAIIYVAIFKTMRYSLLQLQLLEKCDRNPQLGGAFIGINPFCRNALY
jgi:hypothetical protein